MRLPFFTKKSKPCPLCGKDMTEYPEHWECNPCESIIKSTHEFLDDIASRGGSVSGAPRYDNIIMKHQGPIKRLFKRFGRAIYAFKNPDEEY